MGRTPDWPDRPPSLRFVSQRSATRRAVGQPRRTGWPTRRPKPSAQRDYQFHLDIAAKVAPTWEKRRAEIEEFSAPVRRWMLRQVDPQQGDTLLELAAGVGDTGFEAAEIIGGRGRLITSDLSPAMLDAARRRGHELGLGNVDYRVINAEHIPLDDDSVDGVLCRFGYMLMPDPAAAFAETRRVLRPGGRVALAVWGAMERNPWLAIAGISLGQRGHIPPRLATRAGAVQHGDCGAGRGSPCATRDSPRRGSRRSMGGSRSPTPTTTWA